MHGTQYGAPSTWRDVEIVLAGWSSRESAPKALLFESCNNLAGKEITRFIRPALPDLRFETGDIAQSGLEIMRAQRAAAFPVKDNSSGGFIKDSYPRRIVRGFAQHTIVTRNSIETRILERWPDKIGLIDSIGGLRRCAQT